MENQTFVCTEDTETLAKAAAGLQAVKFVQEQSDRYRLLAKIESYHCQPVGNQVEARVTYSFICLPLESAL